MSAREEIMAAVRANQPAGDFPLPETVVFPMDERETGPSSSCTTWG